MIKSPGNRSSVTSVSHGLANALLCLAGLIVVTNITAAERKPAWKITTKCDDDKVEVNVTEAKTVLSIHSPTGISAATIDRTAATWPDIVIFRLRLKGLESFQVSNGDVALHASVSSHADSRVRLWKDEHENSPLGTDSAYWMQIRLVGSDGKPTKAIPLKDGYFEMQLPQAFLSGNPQSIKLQWIDFYRN